MSLEEHLQKLNERQRKDLLLTIYGDLLSDRQYSVCELYLGSDFNFTEIGKQLGCSRQAVHDSYKRAMNSLEDYEEKIGMLEFKNSMAQDLQILLDHVDNLDLDSASLLIRALINRCDSFKTGIPGTMKSDE